jgi:hypothetical protein
MKAKSNCLYYQMRRIRNRSDKLESELKNAKIEREMITFISKIGFTFFVLSYAVKLFGY